MLDSSINSSGYLGAIMQTALFVSQLVISFFVAIVFMKGLTWLVGELSRQRTAQPLAEDAQNRHWPRWAQRLSLPLLLVLPVANRFSRDSAEIRRQLVVIGCHRQFDDREFSRLQIAASLLAGALVCVLMLLLGQTAGVPLSMALLWGAAAFVLVAVLLRVRLRDRYQVSKRRVSASLPNLLDVLALTLESGQNFQSAVQLAISRMPESERSLVLKAHLQELTRELRSGETRANALQKFSDRLSMPEITQFVASILTAERQGASISNILRRQAEQLRITRALAAERVAMKAPVKLLAPLAICIFPCTFAILMFPIAVRLSDSGLF
jgi:tight adherence protein C